jgi:hypothetical protein
MYFVSIHENRRMASGEIVLRRGEGERGRTMERVNLRNTVNTYVNITTYPPVQLLYANKIIKKNKNIATIHLFYFYTMVGEYYQRNHTKI